MGGRWTIIIVFCLVGVCALMAGPSADDPDSYTEMRNNLSGEDYHQVADLVFPPLVETKYLVVPPEVGDGYVMTGNEDWEREWVMTFRRVITPEYAFRCCLRNVREQIYKADCIIKTGASLDDDVRRLRLKFPRGDIGEIAQRVTVDRFSVRSEDCPGLVPLSQEVTTMTIPVFLPNYMVFDGDIYEFEFPRLAMFKLRFELSLAPENQLSHWAASARQFLVGYRADQRKGTVEDYFRARGEEWTRSNGDKERIERNTPEKKSGYREKCPAELLIEAIRRDDLPAIKKLIAAGADPNCHVGRHRETPLTAAAVKGNQAILDFLLAHGAKIEGRDGEGETPLIAAAMAENRAIAIQLLDAGANVNARDLDGRTALWHAAANGDLLLARQLVDRGADISSRTTAFGMALVFQKLALAEFLFSRGVDINIPGTGGDTTLSWAVRRGYPDLVDKIIALKPDLNEKWKTEDEYRGYTPLMMAIEAGHTGIARLLLDSGAAPNIHNIEKMTALMLAVIDDQEQIMAALLDRGAEVATRDVDGWEALMYAARFGRVDLVDRLLAAGASVAATDNYGFTPLMIAAWNGHAEVVRRLLDAGADPVAGVRDGVYRGKRALDLARAAGAAEIVALLTAE